MHCEMENGRVKSWSGPSTDPTTPFHCSGVSVSVWAAAAGCSGGEGVLHVS